MIKKIKVNLYEKFGKFCFYLIIILVVSYAIGRIFSYAIYYDYNKFEKIENEKREYFDKFMNLNENIMFIAESLCENLVGEEYEYAFYDPIDSAWGKRVRPEELCCYNKKSDKFMCINISSLEVIK